MIIFIPPIEERESAGEKHILSYEEAEYMTSTGTLIWNETKTAYELAPGKVWEDYVRDMSVIEPKEPYFYDDDET